MAKVPAKKTVKKAPAKKAAAKTTAAATTAAAKKAAAKKVAAKKASTKKAAAPAKKVAAKKAAASAKPAAAAKKPVVKKAAAKKAPTKKAAAPAKKAAAPKAAAPGKKAVAPAPKAAEKKAAAEKVAAKKATPATKRANQGAGTTPAPDTVADEGTVTVEAAPPKKPLPKIPERPKLKSNEVICSLSGLTVTVRASNLSPKTLERLKGLLIEERARHVDLATELQAEADLIANEREQGDTQFDEESGEGDTLSIERERGLQLSAASNAVVIEIDRALERMANGTYGVCAPSGRALPVERLEVLPWAEVCVDCKSRVERRR